MIDPKNKRRNALGRGLSALLSDSENPELESGPVAEQANAPLEASVRKMGGDTYQLISGERRLQASKMAGMQTIPAYVRTADDEQMLEMALIGSR